MRKHIRLLVILLVLAVLLPATGSPMFNISAASLAVAPTLGAAESFAVLGGETVTNTGPTVINANLGVWSGSAITGFPPGVVVAPGVIHAGDAVAAQAQNDVTTAYNALAGQDCDVILTGQDLGGLTLAPGVYCFGTSAQLTGQLSLNAQGDSNAVFVFKIGSTLTTAANSSVVFVNGGPSCNVFWQIGSSATFGIASEMAGNVLALTSATLTTGARVTGRVLARNGAVTLDTNAVIPCVAAPAATYPGAYQYTRSCADKYTGPGTNQYACSRAYQYARSCAYQYTRTSTNQYARTGADEYPCSSADEYTRTGADEYPYPSSDEHARTGAHQHTCPSPNQYTRPGTHKRADKHACSGCHQYTCPSPNQYAGSGAYQHTFPSPNQYTCPGSDKRANQHACPYSNEYTCSGSDQHARAGADEYTRAGADQHTRAGADQHACSGADQHACSGADQHACSGADQYTRPDPTDKHAASLGGGTALLRGRQEWTDCCAALGHSARNRQLWL